MTVRGIGSALFGLGCLGLVSALGYAMFLAPRTDAIAVAGEDVETASIASEIRGPSGLPLPRFVSLKAEKVNVRRGPASGHEIAWVFQRKGLPVEIVAESDNWRRIRDSDGAEGWILQNMLTGKRTAAVAPWRQGDAVPLYASAALTREVARLSSGVVAEIDRCDGLWCEVSAGGYSGFMEQTQLWGVYPNEVVGD